MLTFLRKIRKSLIDSGRTRKYLLYALGEIALVVIGILIALQINNRSEDRKNIKIIGQYLEGITKDLKTDTATFNQGINRAQLILKRIEWTLSKKNYSTISIDSLQWALPSNYLSSSRISNPTFKKMKNENFSSFPHYDELLDAINKYYTIEYERYNQLLEWDIRYADMENMIKIYGQDKFELNSPFQKVQTQEQNAKEIRTFFSSPKTRNSLIMDYNRKSRIVEEFKLQKDLAIDLLNKIKDY